MTFDRKQWNIDYRIKNAVARNKRLGDLRRLPKDFVAIDSEGVSTGEFKTIGERGDKARLQRTVFWGASSLETDPIWLTPKPGEEYCRTRAILDWLIALPDKFPRCNFVWFGSSYDATQLFTELPFEKAWELQRGKPFPVYAFEETVPSRMGRYVFFEDFAFSYIKSKCLTIGLLKDRENPRNKSGVIQFKKRVQIFDVFGFFQTSFLKAAESIPGSIVGDEFAIIEEGKKARGDFTHCDIESMKKYTTAELHVLARIMTIMRDKLESLNIHITRWQGAGSIASALMTREGSKKHFEEVRAADLREQQEWAHRAFFGGRIECLKQGRTENSLYQGDVRSAYPFHMARLPSMTVGAYEFVAQAGRKHVDTSNVLSMFELELIVEVSALPHSLNRTAEGFSGPEFYPLPYRDTRGAITFPPRARGIYMQAEASAAFAWLDYWQRHWKKKHGYEFPGKIKVGRAAIYDPVSTLAPMEWLSKMYDERRDIVTKNKAAGTYDLAEKILKLGINSVYGKTAQSVGSGGRPPATTCPWYAAAITAGTRAQLLRAALTQAPGSIVAFMTDGIVSTRKLVLPEGPELGQWELEKIDDPSIFIQPGVYHLGTKPRHRGIKAELIGAENMGDWLDENVVPGWRDGKTSIVYPYRYYVTLGAAVASEERWQLAGHWVDGTRELYLNNLGRKRAAPISDKDKCLRSERLIDTIPKPAYFDDDGAPDNIPMSAPHSPEWLESALKDEFDLAREMEEISLARDLD